MYFNICFKLLLRAHVKIFFYLKSITHIGVKYSAIFFEFALFIQKEIFKNTIQNTETFSVNKENNIT